MATDSAVSTLRLIKELPTTPLEKFYEHQLETYRDLCERQQEYLILVNLSDVLNELQNQEQKDLVLRKLVVTNPHAVVLEQLLKAGANPLAKGAQTGLNAIDRARIEKLDHLATKLENYVKEKGLTEPASNLSNNNQQVPSDKFIFKNR